MITRLGSITCWRNSPASTLVS